MINLPIQENLPEILLILGFALIHLTSKYFPFEPVNVKWLSSFAAGVGVAYVVLDLFPYIPHSQEILNEHFGWSSGSLYSNMVYILVLLGITIFYGLVLLDEKAIRHIKEQNSEKVKDIFFWTQISFFAVYSLLIGYITASGTITENTNAWIYFVAFGLHFFVIDWELHHYHKKLSDIYGNKILALSVFLGGVLAFFLSLPEYLLVSFKSFIIGAMVLNVFKYELPSEKQGSLTGFLIGSFAAAALFILV